MKTMPRRHPASLTLGVGCSVLNGGRKGEGVGKRQSSGHNYSILRMYGMVRKVDKSPRTSCTYEGVSSQLLARTAPVDWKIKGGVQQRDLVSEGCALSGGCGSGWR